MGVKSGNVARGTFLKWVMENLGMAFGTRRKDGTQLFRFGEKVKKSDGLNRNVNGSQTRSTVVARKLFRNVDISKVAPGAKQEYFYQETLNNQGSKQVHLLSHILFISCVHADTSCTS